MPNDITHFGQQVALFNDDRTILSPLLGTSATPQGGIAHMADLLGLFNTTATLGRAPGAITAFQNPPAGGGYTGNRAIAETDWTFSVPTTDGQIVLGNETFTATGNPMNNVDGAFISDSDGNEFAYWQRSTDITLATNDTITADTLTIRIV